MHLSHVLISIEKIFTRSYHMIYVISNKMLTQKILKTWRAEKKQRQDLDSAQKTTLATICLILWTDR